MNLNKLLISLSRECRCFETEARMKNYVVWFGIHRMAVIAPCLKYDEAHANSIKPRRDFDVI